MGYIVHGNLQARILEWVDFPSPGGLPNPGIEHMSPSLQADSLPAESPGKPKNTGVGSLSLLQWIFPTQESNWGLLHCRWILYQLSCQGSQLKAEVIFFFSLWARRKTLALPVSQVSWPLDWNCTLILWDLQLADSPCRSWNLPDSTIIWVYPL